MRRGTGALALLIVVGAPGEAARARAPKKVTIDPEALAALDGMGAFLRSQKAAAVTARLAADEVLPSGEKVKYLGTAQLQIRHPDGLHVEVASDRKDWQLFYDGKNATIFQPRSGYYSTFAAPPTLGELVDVAGQKYGIDLPLAELFRWGAENDGKARVLSAVSLGPSKVEDADCAHFAFHQRDVDWQIWIERGEQPLPRRLVVTTITERSQPEHDAILSWNLAPELDDQSFAFVAMPGAQQIELQVMGRRARHPGRGARTAARAVVSPPR